MSKSTAKSNSKGKGKQKSGSDESRSKEKPDVFVWTDDEVQLLLKVTLEYKTSKAIENVDWESIQNKYTEILTIFKERLPALPDEGKKIGKDYPHKPEEITKGTLTSKLKSIRQKYRRRSGHERVVLLYFDDYEKIWRGCPATDQIGGGIESTDLDLEDTSVDTAILHEVTNSLSGISKPSASKNINRSAVSSPAAGSSRAPESVDGSGSELRESFEENSGNDSVERNLEDNIPEDQNENGPSTSTPFSKRRDMLNAQLKNYKQDRLKRTLSQSVDSQLLNCAQQDIEIKKRIIDQMDKEYSTDMKSLSSNMEKLTNSIADGFLLLKNLMMPQQQQQQLQMPYNVHTYTRSAPPPPPPPAAWDIPDAQARSNNVRGAQSRSVNNLPQNLVPQGYSPFTDAIIGNQADNEVDF